MKNNFSRSGFTLVELLAFIVILAIILVISLPLVMDILGVIKKDAFKATANSIADAGRILIANEGDNSEYQSFYYLEGVEYNADNKKLDYSGDGPITGVVVLNGKGKVALAIHDGTYCAIKSTIDNKVSINEATPDNCNSYNVITTCDTWDQLASYYDLDLNSLLEINNETDSNSSTCNRNIKIPILANAAEYKVVGANEAITYYKTYYTVGYFNYSQSFTSTNYEYTVKLGNLPLNITDIENTTAVSTNIYSDINAFKRYIVKKNMGEISWLDGTPLEISLSQAKDFRSHALDSTNVTVNNVTVTCNTTDCNAVVNTTINNLNDVNPNIINSNSIVYIPIKFKLEFNGAGL
jgi:type II secretory pathway pseudopilin PulG